jgi:iron(III) transport system substrate-binding protein
MHRWRYFVLILSVPINSGCVPRTENEVVVYCALDQEFAAPILAGYVRSVEGKTITRSRFDVESTKTVGLANRILAERNQPTCDIFWNNEVLHTIRLQRQGILQKRSWPVPADWPHGMKSRDGSWCGFAARARVLLVNRDRLPDKSQWPRSVNDLVDVKWHRQCAVARPLFGTTATHFVTLNHVLGRGAAEKFFKEAAENAVVLAGNKQVALAVSAGTVAWGLTDTDDAAIEIDQRNPVSVVWPDQAPGEPGTLRVPNTVAVLATAPHPHAAGQLADYLVDVRTEERLAMGDSAQIPLHREAKVVSRLVPEEPVRWMEVDFETAAEDWESVSAILASIFL